MAADVRKYTADVRKYGADVRKYLEGALGNLTPSGARDLAKSMVEQAQDLKGKGPSEVAGQAAGQIRELAQQLLDWSQQSRERVLDLISREVRRQMKVVGVATTEELDALRKRVRELEKSASPPKRSSTSRAKRTTAKKSTAKSTASKTSGGGSASAGAQDDGSVSGEGSSSGSGGDDS